MTGQQGSSAADLDSSRRPVYDSEVAPLTGKAFSVAALQALPPDPTMRSFTLLPFS